MGNGLYAILGNDSDEQDYLFYYDTHGVLRGEIPILFYRAHRLLFKNDLMYFSVSTKCIVGMNSLGRIEKFLSTGDNYILHHDYALDANGDLVVLATDERQKTVQDKIIKIDTDSGKVSELVDMGKLYQSYMDSTAFASMGGASTSSSGSSDSGASGDSANSDASQEASADTGGRQEGLAASQHDPAAARRQRHRQLARNLDRDQARLA
ncbi:aryl-sulfate sulfotransferase [Bifidobacterium sp.]|uniref:aryl-sulfate sulfotransferase n=1 Tax=Bifidobacterium sp. TaxID=41200 RepID=UPI0025C50588|nr:aryl-sulfate sulfotransferase [Bifidobacterium sp.]